MTVNELIENVSVNTNTSYAKTKKIVHDIFKEISTVIYKNDTLTLCGFGTFYTRHTNSRNFTVPSTGKKMVVPARIVLAFRPSKKVKLQTSTNG
jgi:DNA-binding protein HU-beta